MSRIRVLIADDHALLREGICALLRSYDDIEVVGEAGDGREAIEKARRLRPDVVLMDIAMPGLGGLEATLELRKLDPPPKVLVLTQYDNKEYVLRFLKAGAAGFVIKKAVGTELVSALRSVAQGDSYLYPSITRDVIEEFLKEGKPGEGEGDYEDLTDREKQVLKLIAEGYTSKEIASILGISVKTVMGHRTHLMEKLGLHSRTELVKFAIRKGLIEISPFGP